MFQKLDQLIEYLPLIQKTYPEDTSGKIIAYLPGDTIDFKFVIGESIDKSSVTYKALQSRKRIREERGAELFGFTYVSTANPIVVNEMVIGVLTTLVSTENIDTLRKEAEKLKN